MNGSNCVNVNVAATTNFTTYKIYKIVVYIISIPRQARACNKMSL